MPRFVARIVIVLEPTNRGIEGTLQLAVPEAVPDPPFEFVQVTEETPTGSRVVPLSAIEAAEVVSVVSAGERIVRVGGDVSTPVDGGA